MDFAQFQNIVRFNMPFDTGNMFSNGTDFFDTPYFYRASYNINRVPYIVFNEEGTIYTQKNKGFISQKTVGMINRATYSENLGLPFDTRPINNTIGQRNNQVLISMGVMNK